MQNASSSNLRWKIAFLLCLASALNAIDRNAFGILANTIQDEFSWSDADYANLTALFIFSYTLMYALSGRIVDAVGTKRGLGVFLGGWSAVTILHAAAHTLGQFGAARFFLGIAESANFPAGVKAAAEWFPVRERALAIGIFNAGTAIGAAVAVPIVSMLAIYFGWRSAFVATGLLGFVWLFFWLRVYRTPAVASGSAVKGGCGDFCGGLVPVKEAVPLRLILWRRETWGCFCARIFIDPVTYFLLFWIPKYLQDSYGLSLAELGIMVWLPYASMGVGTVLGGLLPKFLVERRAWSLNAARKTVMLAASLAIALFCGILYSGPSATVALAALSLMTLCHGLWANITISSEIYPASVQATITGVGGTLGGLTSVASQKLLGATLASYSYLPVFAYIGSSYILAFVCVCILVGKLGDIRTLSKE